MKIHFFSSFSFSFSFFQEFGTLIQRLEKFDCGRNKFSDMTKKWSTTWKEKDKYTTVFTEGYTEGEASDWALEAQSWYPDAYEVWQRMFSHKWASADLSEFLRVVRLKMGDDWRERYEPKVRAFYFQSKHNLGFAPRFDQLVESEQGERAAALKKAKQWHEDKIPELKKEARALRVRKQAVSDISFCFVLLLLFSPLHNDDCDSN